MPSARICAVATAGEQQQEAAWLGHWVDIANRLGASHIRVFGGKVPEGADEDDSAKWVTEILKRSAEYARSKGVILGLENHGGITSHAKRIVEIVEAVDHPWVGINLDTGNFRSNPYAQMETCLPYAVNSQFKVTIHYEDGRREACDWERVMKMFAESGYRAMFHSNTKRRRIQPRLYRGIWGGCVILPGNTRLEACGLGRLSHFPIQE